MSSYLPYIFLGIASGSVYSLAGVGLILTYKTSATFNFAHGALATAAAYVFYTLHEQHQVPWPLAAMISVLVLGPVLGIGFEGFGRGLSRTPMVWRIAATVGILVSIEALFTIIYGPNQRTFSHFLPNSTFSVFGANVTWEQLIVVLISLSATAGLSIFFRVSRTGIAMRAVVDDPDLLDTSGISPVTIRRWAWVIGCVFATLSGILLAPSVNLDPGVLTLLIVQAFGAAAIGGFSSLPLTYVGGIGIGVIASLSSKWGGGVGSIIGGLPASLPFIVLFVVLLLAPRGRLAVKEVAILRRPITWTAPPRAQYAFGSAVLVVLVLAPSFTGFNLDQWTLMLTDVILFLSLGLLVRSAGQVSLCQVTFAAIGAAVFARLTDQAGFPWFLALFLAGLVAIPIGAVLAIPAIRRSGLYLALATFGFALLVQNMFYNTSWMFGSNGSGVNIHTPGVSWMASTKGYYYVVLTITVLLAVMTVAITRSRLGRLLKGISDSPVALSAQGTSINITLVLIFCVSAFMAAISGALAGGVLGAVGGLNYDPFTSLLFVATIMITVGNAPWYALLAAVGLALGPVYITASSTFNYLSLAFGASAVFVALRGQPEWTAPQRLIDRWFGGRARQIDLSRLPGDVRTGPDRLAAVPKAEPAVLVRLETDEIAVRYGGLVAVADLSVQVCRGVITGLIGPNGAGKSSTLNVCSGLVRPSKGQVRLDGRNVGRLGLAARARLGIGRTFQQMELFETLSVRENIALGREGAFAGANLVGHVVGARGNRDEIYKCVHDAADRCGLTPLLDSQVGSLTTGQRRLVEFARCLAGPFQVLLMDEPSSGLDHRETERFGQILRAVVEERDLAILLVEHDMELVMRTCDQIYVMDFGRLIFEGSPAQVRASNIVRSAYLGSSLEDNATAPPDDRDSASAL